MKKNLFFFVFMTVLLGLLAGCSGLPSIQINTPVPSKQNGNAAPTGQVSVAGTTFQLYAPGANPAVNTPDAHGRIAGFGLGLWHGFISPVTLVISLFNKDVQMYDVHNVGNLYALGFLLGVAIVFIFLGVLFGSRR